jgi:hypothetical protein
VIGPIYVEAVGLAAPGLPGWSRSIDVLAGTRAWIGDAEARFVPTLLPANERRRATDTIRRAFQAGEDAREHSSLDFSQLATIFATSDADMGIIHRISCALAEPQRMVSPTDFHNSVHNAASGYWSIAVQQRAAASAVAAYDGSAASGLLEAATLSVVDGPDSLLLAYDVPAPAPLLECRPLAVPAGVALTVCPRRPAQALASLRLCLCDEPETTLSETALESLRLGNPALRLLPVLRLLALRRAGRVVLGYGRQDGLAVDIQPL